MNNELPKSWGWVPVSEMSAIPPGSSAEGLSSASKLGAVEALYQKHCQGLFNEPLHPQTSIESLVGLLEKADSVFAASHSLPQRGQNLQTDIRAIVRLTLQGVSMRIARVGALDATPALVSALERLSVLIEKSTDLRRTSQSLCMQLLFHLDRASRGLPGRPLPGPLLNARLVSKTDINPDPHGPLPFRRIKTMTIDVGSNTSPLVMTNSLGGGTFGKFRLGLLRPGELLAIKELRLPRNAGDYQQGKRTVTSDPRQVNAEVTQLMTIGSRLNPLHQIDYRNKRYLVMEAMIEELLTVSLKSKRLHKDSPQGAQQTRRTLANSMLLQVARELDVLHRAGAIHCDLKPNNILVAKDGSIVLGDLGSTKARGAVRRSGCTPQYMPFEDDGVKALELRPAFDVFSLGISWLAVLLPEVHQRSWSADRITALRMHLDAHQIDPVVACFVFDRMLNAEPDLRPSAREVADFMDSRLNLETSRQECQQIATQVMRRTLAQHETIRTRLERALQDSPPTESSRISTRARRARAPKD